MWPRRRTMMIIFLRGKESTADGEENNCIEIEQQADRDPLENEFVQ